MRKLTKSKTVSIGDDNGEVLLTTSVGNGDIGGGNLKEESNGTTKVVAKGLLNNYSLGTGKTLKTKKYIVTTNGLDINPNRDDIPATHSFTGKGVQGGDQEFLYPEPSDGTVVADKDGLISYVITYTFN